MKCTLLLVIILCLTSCNRSDKCWDSLKHIEEKTSKIHKSKNESLTEKLKKIRQWQDSLKIYKEDLNSYCLTIEFHGKLIYNVDKVIAKNRDFIRTHEKINE